MCTRCAADPTFRAQHRNAASFRAGPDRRRHRFTVLECRRGFWALLDACNHGSTLTPERAYRLGKVLRYLRARDDRLAAIPF
jgi:hypothetical protein